MIISCAQCHTRFKVPDGKVTARGRKVRCSRCGHTFRIFPESASDRVGDAAPAAPRPSVPDPFQAFGPEGTLDMEKTPARGTTVSALLAQMAPAQSAEDFDVDVSGEPPVTEPAWNFPPPPAPPDLASGGAAVDLEAEPARAHEVPGHEVSHEVSDTSVGNTSLDQGGLGTPDWPDDLASHEAADTSFDTSFGDTSFGDTSLDQGGLGTPDWPDDLAAVPPDPVSVPPPAPPEDLSSMAGFTPAWGVAAPVRALSVDGTLGSHVSSLAPAAEPESPPPAPQFGGAGTVLDDLPTLEPASRPPSDLELDPGNDARDWTGAAPGGHLGMQLELEPDLASLELDRRPPPEPRPASPPDPAWALPVSGGSPAPAAPASFGLAWDDPFGEPLPPPPAPASPQEPAIALSAAPAAPNSVLLDEAPAPPSGQPDHGFFEMSGASPSSRPEPSGALLPDVPEAEEPSAAPGSTGPGRPAPMPAISKPPGRARLGLQEREQLGTARRVSAVILNVGLAALLLLVVLGLASSWVTAGRVDGSALSPRRLLQALRSGSGVTPVEVTPGTYETRSGRSLLYVRGRVLNRGAPSARVRVRVEVWDGAQAVKSGETLAGAIATPEELWRAATPADLDALRARLVSAATPVADGQQADFLVLLDEAPPDLSGLRLRVTASVER